MKLLISISKYIDNTRAGRAMMKYKGKGCYIHFGQSPKIGVSTHHAHSDPHGIYFYALDWLIDNAKYDQYALTYPYYTIVTIRPTQKGIILQNFTEKNMEYLCIKSNLLNTYDDWVAERDTLYRKAYKIQKHVIRLLSLPQRA